MKLQIIVDSRIRIPKRGIKDAGLTLRELRAPFEYDNPDYFKKQRMGHWVGNTPRKLTLVETTERELLLPRGGWPRLRELLWNRWIKWEVNDRTVRGTGPLGLAYAEPPEWKLGPDQLTAAKAIVDNRNGIILGVCGSGKSELLLKAISDVGERTLVVVHTDRILATWVETAIARFGVSESEIGVLRGGTNRERNFTVGMVRTLLNLIERDPKFVDRWGFVAHDEVHHCFPKGTLIDGRPIESIQAGDFVPAFDPNTMSPTIGKVIENLERSCVSLIEIEIVGQRIAITPDHPIFTDRGWVNAGYLQCGDVVLSFTDYNELQKKEMYRMWKSDGWKGNWSILRRLSKKKERSKFETRHLHVRRVWNYFRAFWKKATRSKKIRVLFEKMSRYFYIQKIVGKDDQNEHVVIKNFFSKNEDEKSNAQSDYSSESFDDFTNERLETSSTRWQRKGTYCTSTPLGLRTRLGNGSVYQDWIRSWKDNLSNLLQSRCSKSRTQDSDRSGRTQSQCNRKKKIGCKTRHVPRWLRVDHVKILEQGRDGTFGGRAPKGRVHNLRVEENETFLVGNLNLAVHNCPANTFNKLINSFPAKWRIGATATPKRKDGKEALMYDTFGSIYAPKKVGSGTVVAPKVLHEITDADLDRSGRIVPVDVVVVPTEFDFDLHLERKLEREGVERKSGKSSLTRVRAWAKRTKYRGTLNTYSEMLDAMVRDQRRLARILNYLLPEVNAGETCLLLGDRRELCLELEMWLRRKEIPVGRLMGGSDAKKQDRTAAELSDGTLRVAVGTTVADEGMNLPRLSRGFGCTPVGSNPGRLIQQVGRFKRKYPGKRDAVYFYFLDANVRTLRGHARAVLNTIQPPHCVWFSRKPGERVPLTLDLVTELEKRYGEIR